MINGKHQLNLFILLFIWISWLDLNSQPCSDSNITLLDQGDVDSLQIRYGSCDSIIGILQIGTYANPSSDISDLTPLSGLTFAQQLIIVDNDSLLTLDGLHNFNQDAFSKLTITRNLQLHDISQLSGFGPGGGNLGLDDNPAITSLWGLHNIRTLGTSLTVRAMPGLTDLNELSGIARVDRSIAIQNNDNLTDISGLGNIALFGTGANPVFIIEDNDQLEDCSPVCFLVQRVLPLLNNLTKNIQNNLGEYMDEQAILSLCANANHGIYSGSGEVPTSTVVDIIDSLTFGDNTLVVNETTNKVGIGTPNPTYELDIIGDVGISGAIYGLSDERLKQNVSPINNALSIISKLDPKIFLFDTEGNSSLNLPTTKQYGLMAQEVEKVMPELISTMTAPDGQTYKTVNYNALIAVLIAAVQEGSK